jgi:hypothetical protein
MGLTLIEAAKLSKDAYKSGIIEMYAGSSAVLRILPFELIAGNALKYNRESSLPGVGFRGVNEGYTASTGVLNPMTESLVIAGGDLDVDKFIVDTMGADQRSVHEAMKARSLSLAWTAKFFNGDTADDPREFDGLKKRITGSQLIAAGTTNGGTALSLAKLDEAIDQTMNPSVIFMNKAMKRLFNTAGRSSTLGAQINIEKNDFGYPITYYAGIPIETVDLDNEGNEIITNTEATYTSSAWGGTATGTSIYLVSVGSDMLTGIQNGGMDVRDLGELQTSPLYRTRIEWYNGIAIYNGRAVTRLGSISTGAITA